MGDLDSGYEEVDGVKLGYLIIKGKQMFALSQVFTDLLKNIPRTTVHKRMDHLKINKHHCDLEELRKLKAIHSIAFHAAKCTLISREDVETLYTSCKTERVLKTKRRKLNRSFSSKEHGEEQISPDSYNSFWKQNKVWLSLHGAPQPFSFKSKPIQQEEAGLLPASNLPHIYSKYAGHGYPAMTRLPCTNPQNYETAQIPSNYVAFHPSHSFFRSVVCSRHPVFYQSAIVTQPKLASTTDLTCKRKRSQESTGKHFWNSSISSRRVLLAPKRCKSKVASLDRFHIEHGLYLGHQQGTLQESYSSDSESSSFSDRADNDSDFGSSLSTTSNSGTSDDDDEESLSDSSDGPSDEDSSSQSDSSSVSSQVSVQSIRFRRTSFSTPNNKPPLLAQPTFYYNIQPKCINNTETTVLEDDISNGKLQKYLKPAIVTKRHEQGWTSKPRKALCSTSLGGCFLGTRSDRISQNAFSHSEISDNLKRTDPTINSVKERGSSLSPKENTAFPQQRIEGQANCPQASSSHCAENNETIVSKPSDNDSSLVIHFKKETKIGNCGKLSPDSRILKTEQDLIQNSPDKNIDAVNTGETFLHSVKIKVEENCYDDYSPEDQFFKNGYECNVNKKEVSTTASNLTCEDNPRDTLTHAHENIYSCIESPTTSPKNQDFQGTLRTPYLEEWEYKNGARVRKNYRTLVLGKRPALHTTPVRLNVKSDRTPRSTGKNVFHEGTLEDCTGTSKRKRVASGVASAVKKPFNFMANFPTPPSLIIGSDGDLCPAYSLNSLKDPQPLHKAHPVWKWQLGSSAIPLPPSHKFRKFNL
ncbi:SKI/DACH domain-containing protein 1-like [Huso huso]|uniref:SKI/DACH domain-containing protein 1-like n=1 Tax=Huso huso TaxID=61971 RepID=A0ABR0ZZP3_HUSHU